MNLNDPRIRSRLYKKDGSLTTAAKVLACYGNIITSDIFRVVGCTAPHVYSILVTNGLHIQKKKLRRKCDRKKREWKTKRS